MCKSKVSASGLSSVVFPRSAQNIHCVINGYKSIEKFRDTSGKFFGSRSRLSSSIHGWNWIGIYFGWAVTQNVQNIQIILKNTLSAN